MKVFIKQKFSTIGLFFIFFIVGCKNEKKQHSEIKTEPQSETKQILETGKIIDKVTGNGSSYTYYIPISYTGKEKFPAIIFLDPHGDGRFPLEKYKKLADEFQCILAGSNESKNGKSFEEIIKISSELLTEVKNILPVNPQQVALAGFSGGAKAALVCGNTVEGFNTIIYCGAAIPPRSMEVKIPLIAFAGNRDMNYTEIRNFNYSLNQSKIPHTLVEWNGKHEWPDSTNFKHAIYWNIFTSIRKNNFAKDKILIDDYKKMLDASVENEKNILVKSLLLEEGIAMLQGINPVNNYKSIKSELVNSKSFRDLKTQQETILRVEEIRKKEFADAFANRELPWWNNQINILLSDKNNFSNQRILGYISLAAWSYSSKAVAVNDSEFAKKTLTIYKLADPENPEQPFLTACLYSKNGNPDSAIYFLNEAIKLGLNEKSKIENQQDLFSLRGRNDYRELISKLR